jgi:hypothetical protein
MDILFNISMGDQSGIKLNDKIVLEISKRINSNDHIKLEFKTDNKYCKEVKIPLQSTLANRFINE